MPSEKWPKPQTIQRSNRNDKTEIMFSKLKLNRKEFAQQQTEG